MRIVNCVFAAATPSMDLVTAILRRQPHVCISTILRSPHTVLSPNPAFACITPFTVPFHSQKTRARVRPPASAPTPRCLQVHPFSTPSLLACCVLRSLQALPPLLALAVLAVQVAQVARTPQVLLQVPRRDRRRLRRMEDRAVLEQLVVFQQGMVVTRPIVASSVSHNQRCLQAIFFCLHRCLPQHRHQ